MKSAVSKWIVATGIVLILGLGCRLSLTPDDGGGNTPGTGGSVVDGGFSDGDLGGNGNGGSDGGGDPTDPPDEDGDGEETRSFFTAFQVDPVDEDTAGPKFVVAGDVNQDGLTDLVSAWNESQPIQLHLQQRDANNAISFRTVTIAGTNPVAVMAGVELGQINGDGWLDIVVLVKATGVGGWCPTSPPKQISRLEGEIIVYFSPGNADDLTDGDNWTQMILVNPYVQDRWIHNQFPGDEWVDFDELQALPENAGFTALAVGDLDGNPGDEIVVALNPGTCAELGQDPPINTVDLWINPGPELAETSVAWGVPPDIPLSQNVPISLLLDTPHVTDVVLTDVDNDGDLDVVAAYSEAISRNVRWVRNPLIPFGYQAMVQGASDGNGSMCVNGPNDGEPCVTSDECEDPAGIADGSCVSTDWHYVQANWERRPVGQVDTNANVLALGDVDSDGFEDIIVRSTPGMIVQWFRKPNPIFNIPPEFPPGTVTPDRFNFPWSVFTLTEFVDREPEAVACGELTGDGLMEVMVAVEGGVYWYDATVAGSVFKPWVGNTIIQDSPEDTGGTADGGGFQGGVGVGVEDVDTSTVINSLLVVDLDGDGRNDIVATLDRRSGSGLSDDRLVWYRNVRTDEDE